MPNETAQRFLESLEVASPCHVDWEEMTGDEKARFCMHCEKNVYNISEMSRSEAEAFMQKQEGPVCIRMYRRHDGTVINDNCPVGLKKVRQSLLAARVRLWKIAAASFALISSIFVGGSAQAQNKSDETSKAQTGKNGATTTTLPTKDGKEPIKVKPIVGPPTMGLVAPAPTEAILNTEKSFKEQVAAIVTPKLKDKKLTQGTLTFHTNHLGEIDQCNVSQSTGDKELDDSLVAAVKGIKLILPKDGQTTWRWVSVCLSECSPAGKPKADEAK